MPNVLYFCRMFQKLHPRIIFGLLTLLTLASLPGCPETHKAHGGPQPHTPPKAPKLVIGIVVDQMRHDYIARFWNNFQPGGFKRLIAEGASFDNCHYNYVPTETAPGHASIFTGTTPSGHGIIMNDWLDPEMIAKGTIKSHSSVDDSLHPLVGVRPPLPGKKKGASPARLESTTIADQLKQATKGKAITVGVSIKDRSAILPVGKSADAAFWFDDATGNMISSTYYKGSAKGLPKWVDSLNALRIPMKQLQDPDGWTLFLDPAKYTTPDGPADHRYEGTYDAKDTMPYFPHRFTVDTANCCGEYKTTAWGNTFVKDFAIEAIQHYHLGADNTTDFLSVSFSSTDMVGHQFGPQSRELEDTYIRLDRDIADFLTFLDRRIGKENVLVFLTADHAGAPNPVYAQDHGQPGGFLEVAELRRKIRAHLGDQAGKDSLLTAVKGHTIYLNRKLAATRKLDYDSLCKEVVKAMTGFPGVEKAYTAKEVAAIQPMPKGGHPTPENMLQNGYHPARSGDVHFLLQYGHFQTAFGAKEPWRYKKGTSHGSHHDYDTHVPLLWWGGDVPIMKTDGYVEITDIAPTVCKWIGVNMTDKSTGKVIGL
jgi:predicted AlkP superfamily pyrophosphatase or phosphodiesterase